MNFSRLEYLLNQYALNQCSKKELLELMSLIGHYESTEDLELSLRNIWNGLNDQDEVPPIDQEKIYAKIMASQDSPILKKNWLWRPLAAAVIAVILLGIAFYSFNGSQVLNQLIALAKPVKYQITPGTNKATLRLANGSIINLNNSAEPSLTNYGNIQIKKNSNGQIIYQVIADSTDTKLASTYNVFTTPKGGQYEIILADGSKVFLNANSSLTFPTAFSATQRDVVLKGEAYFEIAKNKKKPFKVSANGTEIKVLGTHFNVMAYEDEPLLKTTLFEGSVQVNTHTTTKVIKPGQQAVTYKNQSTIDINESKPDEDLAWKNGYFLFQDEGIESVMRKIARWYDVEVVYKESIPGGEFGGKISRYKNILDVLKPLELTGSVHFKLEGRRIIVTQ
ncbi:FecR family protein [Pedobacter sp. ok626]|uniref:FecR family protein n=1 Tax=Pedobacter sp. ok626 TaxID=1761882 RepID=UPI0008909CAD|nr:FecR family protein [Pedobacter sp. ok626]SDL35292.1 FecR family protein [Pedobacter sp. ok626]